MGVHFSVRDFAHPLLILKLHSEFERTERMDARSLANYQFDRLRFVLDHAYRHVPYYRTLFQEHGMLPSAIASIDDLKKLPVLTKDLLRTNARSLLADTASRYSPVLQSTSGTTGSSVSFYADKYSNTLEFVYYWRQWGWAGYRLGNRIAELSAEAFIHTRQEPLALYRYQRFTRRLLINSLLLSRKESEHYIAILKKFKPLFLKGLPSNLHLFAIIVGARKDHGVTFKAIFSQGENLLQSQRELIEQTFSCKVYDSYGHMERTVAISQCAIGTYHIHSDYGLLELENRVDHSSAEEEGVPEGSIKRIIGTSLHNLAMPLIRYVTGDLAEVSGTESSCACDKPFPSVRKILGRSADIIVTPEGKVITALYVALDRTPGVVLGQITQEKIDHLTVKVACSDADWTTVQTTLRMNLRAFVRDTMRIDILHRSIEDIRSDRSAKFRSVVSHLRMDPYLQQATGQ